MLRIEKIRLSHQFQHASGTRELATCTGHDVIYDHRLRRAEEPKRDIHISFIRKNYGNIHSINDLHASHANHTNNFMIAPINFTNPNPPIPIFSEKSIAYLVSHFNKEDFIRHCTQLHIERDFGIVPEYLWYLVNHIMTEGNLPLRLVLTNIYKEQIT